jgi:hypothetical protein
VDEIRITGDNLKAEMVTNIKDQSNGQQNENAGKAQPKKDQTYYWMLRSRREVYGEFIETHIYTNRAKGADRHDTNKRLKRILGDDYDTHWELIGNTEIHES